MINVVLFEPEIPTNTGNIIRSCAGFQCQLHLIRPYGFFLKDKQLVRSATNHLSQEILEYDDWEDFVAKNPVTSENLFLYTKRGERLPGAFDYRKLENVYLLFGKESTGVPREIMEQYKNWIRVPMDAEMVSLNVSNVVAIAIYEVLRQQNFPNLVEKWSAKWGD